MANGTKFGSIHSSFDLGLIQQQVEVGPALPRINLVDVPGGNGSRDLTEALGIGVTYQDRTLAWTFALYPGADPRRKQAEVSNALNGLVCSIVLDDDPDWTYIGRLQVTEHKSENVLHQIKVSASCRPYKLRPYASTRSADLSSTQQTIVLDLGEMPTAPKIKTTGTAVIIHNGNTYNATAGERVYPAMRSSGQQSFKVSGTGKIIFTWTEGSL